MEDKNLDENLIKLDSQTLNEKLKALVKTERTLLHEVLLHICEVDRRKLYLGMAYPSLWQYLTSEIGYCSETAQRRVDAVRLMQKLPELSAKIKSGALALKQISQVQKISRLVERESGGKVTIDQKAAALEKLSGKTNKQTEFILAQEFDLKIQIQEKARIQKDESVRLELTLSKEQAALLEDLKLALTQKNIFMNTADLLVYLAKRELEKLRGVTSTVEVEAEVKTQDEAEAQAQVEAQVEEPVASKAEPQVESGHGERSKKSAKMQRPFRVGNKSVTPKVRQFILHRDQCCQ